MAARVDLGAGAELVAELEALVDKHPLREGLWASLDHRALPGRSSGRCPCGLRPGAAAARRRARRRAGSRCCAPWSGTSCRSATRWGRPRARGVPPRATCHRHPRAPWAVSPSSPSSSTRRDAPRGGGPRPGRRRQDPARAGGRPRLEAPGGVWLVRLDALEAPAEVERLVAETLRVPGGPSRPARPARRVTHGPRARQLRARRRRTWRARDRLLDAVPRAQVLATSQVPLGIAEEHTAPLAPLSHEDAVALFPSRAAAARPLTVDDAAVALVDELCRSLDGLPLAIELAAARVRSLSLADLARRLDDRFALLRDPSSTRAGPSPDARRRHRVELRPAVPRRPARAVGAVLLRRRRLPRRGPARHGRPRRPRAVGGRHDRPAGRPFAGPRRGGGGRGGALPPARQHQGLCR